MDDKKESEELKVLLARFGEVLSLAKQAIANGSEVCPRQNLTYRPAEQDDEPSEPAPGEYTLSLWREAEMSQAIVEIRKQGLKTNDIIVIAGDQDGAKKRELTINGADPLQLERREFVFLLVLALERKAGGGYLSVKEILDRIQEKNIQSNAKEGLDADEGFWPYPTPADIYTLVSGLRGKLTVLGHAADLIENGLRGAGYRLSTRAANVSVSLFEYEAKAHRVSFRLSNDGRKTNE